jgi:hypothetical protein
MDDALRNADTPTRRHADTFLQATANLLIPLKA